MILHALILTALIWQDAGASDGPTATETPSLQVENAGSDLKLRFDSENGTPVTEVIDFVQRQTGKVLIYSPADLRDVRFFVVGEQTVPKSEVWGFFQAILKSADFVIVPYGSLDTGVLFAVRKTTGGTKPGYIKTQAPVVAAANMEQFKNQSGLVVTTTFALKYVNAQEAVNMLQSYFTDPMLESVRAIMNSNSLVATGYASTLLSMRDLLAQIDVPAPPIEKAVQRIALKNTVAEEMAGVVASMAKSALPEAQPMPPGYGPSKPQPQIVADARTNSLIVNAAAADLPELVALIQQLDVGAPDPIVNQVQRLENASCDELASALRDWANGVMMERQTTISNSKGESSKVQRPGTRITIVAERRTNSLILRAGKQDIAEMLQLIEQLDIAKPR